MNWKYTTKITSHFSLHPQFMYKYFIYFTLIGVLLQTFLLPTIPNDKDPFPEISCCKQISNVAEPLTHFDVFQMQFLL